MSQNPFGSRQALDERFEEAYGAIYAYCRHMCGDPELALDLTQEALARAMANLDRFRGDASFTTWAIAIAVNVYRDYLKKKRPELVSEQDALTTMAYALQTKDSLEQQVEDRAFQADLAQELAAMPPPQRQVFVLRHLVGLSYEEIAQVAGCPLGTVRSRLHNSIETLKKRLGERGWP